MALKISLHAQYARRVVPSPIWCVHGMRPKQAIAHTHIHIQYWFHKMGQIFHQWLACVNAGQPVIRPGASPARQAQNWLRPAHEMGSSPHTVRARKIYPPKSYLGLHPVYCVAANMDAVNHVSSRRADQARSGQDRGRPAWPHSASSKQLWVDLNVQ